MQGEGVTPDRIAALDVADHSAHWARTQAFLGIVAQALEGEAPDAEARLRQAVAALAAAWATRPPTDPVILAGSTGSRGTTALLMQAVARLPQGAVVLPGFDFDLPAAVWDSMDDALTAEDHPQFRFRRLMEQLGCGPDARPALDQGAGARRRPQPAGLALAAPRADHRPMADRRAEAARPAAGDRGHDPARSAERAGRGLAIALILRQAAEDGTARRARSRPTGT